MCLKVNVNLAYILRTSFTALFSPKGPSHALKPVDSSAPHAVVLHDFLAGKDIKNKVVEPSGSKSRHPPWVNLSRTSFFILCARVLDWRGHLINLPTSGLVSCTQPFQKALLHPLAFETPCEREGRGGVTLSNEQIANYLPVANFLAL